MDANITLAFRAAGLQAQLLFGVGSVLFIPSSHTCQKFVQVCSATNNATFQVGIPTCIVAHMRIYMCYCKVLMSLTTMSAYGQKPHGCWLQRARMQQMM